MKGRLIAQAGFQLGNPCLDRGHLPLEIGDALLDDLTAALLVSEKTFDAAQRLRDRVVFLLEPIEAAIDLIEMAENVGSEITQLGLEPIEAAVDLGELALEELDELLVLSVRHGDI